MSELSSLKDQANASEDRETQFIWSALMSSVVSGGTRKEYLRLLGYGRQFRSSDAADLEHTKSDFPQAPPPRQQQDGGSSSEEEDETPLPPIDFQHIGSWVDTKGRLAGVDTWHLVDDLAKGDETATVDKLAAKGDFATAFVVAATSDTDRNELLEKLVKLYVQSLYLNSHQERKQAI